MIVTKQKGHVLLIEINRPAKYNAFTKQMLDDLGKAYTELEKNDDLWCGLLYAKGKHFSAGLDLADVSPYVLRGEPMIKKGFIDPFETDGIYKKKPVVVAVHGLAYTLSIELILAADICIAAAGTTFTQLEVGRGIMPFGGATVRFAQRCGWGNAMRYLLTGDKFDAIEALRIGLVQEVSETAEATFETALKIAETIAAQAPLAVQASLQNARKAAIEGELAAMKELIPIAQKLMQTEDAKEGLQSFVERRTAIFSGK
jgi:enoyl-CoA hydratase/carnithine racemase